MSNLSNKTFCIFIYGLGATRPSKNHCEVVGLKSKKYQNSTVPTGHAIVRYNAFFILR